MPPPRAHTQRAVKGTWAMQRLDLMQLTLGVDRDSEYVAYLNDDKNVSFRRMIQMTIESYHKYGKKVGFCGQQPSNSKEFYDND